MDYMVPATAAKEIAQVDRVVATRLIVMNMLQTKGNKFEVKAVRLEVDHFLLAG